MVYTDSYANIQEAAELEFNSFSSIIDSISVLKEAETIFGKLNTDNAKDIVKDKIKLVWQKIKTWIESIKLKLINYFESGLKKKIDKLLDEANKLANDKDSKLANLKTCRYATLSLSPMDKDKKEISINMIDSIIKETDTLKLIKDLKSYIMDTKFTLEDAIDKNAKRADIKKSIDDKTVDFNIRDKSGITISWKDVDPDIANSQRELRDKLREKLGNSRENSFQFTLQYHNIVLNDPNPKFIVDKYTTGIKAAISATEDLANVYEGLLKKKSVFEKAFSKFTGFIDVAKNGDLEYYYYGNCIKDDLYIIRLEVSLFSALYMGFIKELIANSIELSKLVKKDGVQDKNLEKAANAIKVDKQALPDLSMV